MRKYLNTLIDKVTGFPLDTSLRKVLAMDKWSRQEIEDYQHIMFEKLKQYAIKSSIYKDFKDKSLNEFPVFSRDFYINHEKEFLTRIRKPYREIYTSGTTGLPRKIYVSKEMLLAKRTSHLKMLSWYGLKREDKELYIGWAEENLFLKIYYKIKNKIFLSSFGIDQKKAMKFIKILNSAKPRIVFSYPYALDFILAYAETLNAKLFQPRIIYTGAENLLPYIRERIAKHFPESVLINEYWSTEANIAVECPRGNMHIDEDTVIVEVINKDKNGVGDILITNLFSYDFPLIRYPLGDRIALSDNYCPCGRKTKIISKIYGRVNDYFPLPNGKKFVFLEHDEQIIDMCTNILAYQVLYNPEKHKGIFRYIRKDAAKDIDHEKITNYFRKFLTTDFLLEEVKKIESEPSGKYKIFKISSSI